VKPVLFRTGVLIPSILGRYPYAVRRERGISRVRGTREFCLASSQTNEQTTGLMAAAAVSDEALASVKAAVVRSQ
jgi:hypothetical protein